ncbi:MAG: glycosyltransferase family 4 protein [Acidobacteria bacterium]|nr:glycosyltransferase family 4 protein [Acidobacteriota bacterium]
MEGGRRVAVHQVLATLGYGDAIGNAALGIRRVLRGAGYRSHIYVQTADPRVEDATRDYRELREESRPDNVLIHHFSVGSRASRLAFALPDRMLLVYHNITPPEHFIGMRTPLVRLCFEGRRELRAYVPRCDLALGVSEYNRAELAAMGFPRTGVLPVVPDFSHLDVAPDPLLARGFDDGWTNILFVGRLMPHKCIHDLVRFFHAYRQTYNPRSRLLLVGAYDGFKTYLGSVGELIAHLQVPDVHVIGHVSNEQLTALYDVADVFLSASEHEGFCVPLVESFYKGIPVVAFAAAAVPATLDGSGVLYEHKDPRHVAALLHAVVSDRALESEIVRGQDDALDRYLGVDFRSSLLAFVDRTLRAPRAAPPRVAGDFWRQVADSEALDELRRRRPSIYGALPKAPGSERWESPW